MRKWAGIFFSVALLLCACSIFLQAHPVLAETQKFYSPQLEVPIPGLDFTKYPVVVNNKSISVPFLSAYIAAAYRYIVGISVVAAAVMIVWGGFKYILGSSLFEITTAKETIADALVGLLLIFGTYTILLVLNPQLAQPTALEEYQVTADPYVVEMVANSMTTQANTDITPPASVAPPPTPAPTPAPGGGGQQPAPQPTPPSGQPQPGGNKPVEVGDLSAPCPIQLPAEQKDLRQSAPRRRAFLDALTPTLTGSYTDRISKAANLAIRCQMNFGSCGSDANTMMVIAGIGDASCLQTKDKPPGGGICSWGFSTLAKYTKGSPLVPVDQKQLWGLHTPNDCGDEKKHPPSKNGTPSAFMKFANRPDALPRSQAVQKARDILSAKISGYPNTFADQLQPGDWFYDYNGNSDCAGMHSVVFIGWKDTNGNAYVMGGDINHPVHANVVCLKTTCGASSWLPIVSILRVNQSFMR